MKRTLTAAVALAAALGMARMAQAQMSPIAVFVIAGIVVVVIGVLIRTGHIGLLFFLLFCSSAVLSRFFLTPRERRPRRRGRNGSA